MPKEGEPHRPLPYLNQESEMKVMLAVAATALLTAGGTYAATTLTISAGQGFHIAGTTLGCAAYRSQSGTGLACSKQGSHIYASVGPSGVAITKGTPIGAITTTSQLTSLVAKGNLLLFSSWSGTAASSALATDSKTIDGLQTQLASLQTQLATAKAALASAQSGAVAAIESEGLATVMSTAVPQLGQWLNGQGGDFTQTTDGSDGFADYSLECDSCYTGS